MATKKSSKRTRKPATDDNLPELIDAAFMKRLMTKGFSANAIKTILRAHTEAQAEAVYAWAKVRQPRKRGGAR